MLRVRATYATSRTLEECFQPLQILEVRACRMAVAMRGATTLEKPLGSPRLRRVIIVPLPWAAQA